MPLYSRQDLADHCLRTLGAPVINIEIDDEQVSDAIESAIDYFNDYHPDGVERDYVKHKVIFTQVTVDNTSTINIGSSVHVGLTSAKVLDKVGNVITISKMSGISKFQVGDVLVFPSGTAIITAITLGDPDNGYIAIDEDIQGVIRVMPWIPALADGLFDITYQLRMNDLRNLSSGTMSYYVTTMEYLSMLDFFLRKEKQFRFNRRMNRLYIDQDWGKEEIVYGSYIVVECYRLVSDELFPERLNDPWLKKYAAAWVKRYWGANLRKYNGVQLPGGVTLDGERIYAEANAEIKDLEFEMINNQAPLQFVMG